MNASPSRRRWSGVSATALAILTSASRASRRDALRDHMFHLRRRDALLPERIAIADRDRPVLHRLTVDGDPEGRPDLVLPAVAPPDRARLVEEDGERLPQLLREVLRELRHAVPLHERQHPRL